MCFYYLKKEKKGITMEENDDGNKEKSEIELEFVEPIEPVPEEPVFDSLHKFCESKDPDGDNKCKINLVKLLNGDIDVEKFKDRTKKLIDTPEEESSVEFLLGNMKSQFRRKEE
jgi:hypothetical protein